MYKYFTIINFQGQHIFHKLFNIVFLILTICSCKNLDVDVQFQSIDKNQLNISGIHINYPKEGTVFPPEFPSPQFLWKDTMHSSAKWHIRLTTKSGKELYRGLSESSTWRPDSAIWQNIKTASTNEPVFITIIGEYKSFLRRKYSSGRISFSISTDSVGVPVFYRAVPLPFEYAVNNVDKIEWYAGNIDGGKPRKVLDNIPVCANCHSFSKSGHIAMDVDYANDKGSYIIVPANDTVHLTFDKIITWNDYKKEDGEHTFGLLSQISPDGRYALSTVKDRSVFVAVDSLEYSQLFFPIKGIIAVYDKETNKFYNLPGASDPKFVQSNPNWSPDGNEIIFARANRYNSAKIENTVGVLVNIEDAKEFVTREKEFKFDLYRVPFNNGKGGQAIPIPGASNNKKSNFFARYSPDGKWIVFCQAENFMLLQRDSKLYIMPAKGGVPRLMNCNMHSMNSWHSWSPNSKWLVFSSKSRGPYTQLYLTHIDENGNDSPPVFLENLAFESKAANIPEFLSIKASGLNKMVDNFSQNVIYYTRLAASKVSEKKYKDALKLIEDAIKADKFYYDAYEVRIHINLILGSSMSVNDLRDKAIAKEIIEKQIKNNPHEKSLYLKRSHLRSLNQDYEGALKDAMYVLKLKPNDIEGLKLAVLLYQQMGQWNNAIAYQNKILELEPDNADQIQNLALLYNKKNQPEQAMELLNELIVKYPLKADLYVSRASMMLNKEDYPAAKSDFDRAISYNPDDYSIYRARSIYYKNISSPEMARNDLNKAIELIGEDINNNPQNATLYLNRAEILEQTGNNQGALIEYENYLKNWPINYIVLKNIAKYYCDQRKWQKAIDNYTAIIDSFPQRKQFLYDRSLVYEQLGDWQKALDDLNIVIRGNSKEYRYFYTRARIKSRLGDIAGSNSDIKATAQLLNNVKKERKLSQEEQNLLSSIIK